MLNISRYITIDERNACAWGEEIADIIVLIGNAIDTFFKDMVSCTNIENYVSINRIQQERRKRDIKYYYNIFEPYYELSRNEVKAEFGLGNSQTLTPFQTFSFIRKNQTDRSYIPRWWDAYNDTKHQFYEKMENANLDNSLNALAGLFLLNSLHICSKVYLARRGIINWRGYANIQGGLEGELRKTRIGTTPWATPSQIITSLFVFTHRVDETLRHPLDTNI